MDTSWIEQFPLSVKGSHVVNASGARFRLRGANWYRKIGKRNLGDVSALPGSFLWKIYWYVSAKVVGRNTFLVNIIHQQINAIN